jgi:hypothetical protein
MLCVLCVFRESQLTSMFVKTAVVAEVMEADQEAAVTPPCPIVVVDEALPVIRRCAVDRDPSRLIKQSISVPNGIDCSFRKCEVV